MTDKAQSGGAAEGGDKDISALAKGGRTSFFGFLLRLLARLPFLYFAARFYGADAMGRFAYALIGIELIAVVCSMGEKRGLAQRLSDREGSGDREANIIMDGMVVALLFSVLAAIFLWLVPAPLFPSGIYTPIDRLMVLAIPGFALTEIALAAQAYRFDIGTTVRARAVVEPWTISILAGALYFVPAVRESGLGIAFVCSIYAGLITALIPFFRTYGLPKNYRPNLRAMLKMTGKALPLAGADAIEWGTRRLDIFLLGLFAAPTIVGIYYFAQQFASLPQKLKTSFDPILGPVITKKLKEKDFKAIAKQVCQVGFWIIAAQAGIALALGIPGEAIMGLGGPEFVGGNAALAFLLAAEVVAAIAVVSEAVLIYVARVRNLWISIATIAFQGALTIVAMQIAGHFGLSDYYRAAIAAGSLMVALGLASIVKAVLLSKILKHPINNLRWPLIWAIAAAVLVGQVIILLPEWAELALGIPAILGVYGWIIWTRGFGPEDRVLFAKNKTDAKDVTSDT